MTTSEKGGQPPKKTESTFSRNSARVTAVIIAASSAYTIHNYTDKSSSEYQVCAPVDEAAVQDYARQIKDIYDTEAYTPEDEEKLISELLSSRGKSDLKVTFDDSVTTDGKAAEVVADLTAYISDQYIDASEVDEVVISNLKRGIVAGKTGSYVTNAEYSTRTPNKIYIDKQHVLESPQNEVLGSLSHELGHAIVKRLCGTFVPPEQFTDSNPDGFTYSSPSNSGSVEVSKYAETASYEAVVETMTAVASSVGGESKRNAQIRLDEDDAIAERKIAVTIAMLEKVSPGLGKTAILNLRF